MSSSEKCESDSDDEDVFALKVMCQHQQLQANSIAVASIIYKYYMTYHDKNEPRTSQLSGYGWILETLNTPGESYRMFRMDERLFIKLHDLLVSNYGLRSSIHMNSMESLAIFLSICGQNRSNSAVQNTFKHSGETISRKFDDVLQCLVRMAKDYIRPQDPNFSTVHKRILGDKRIWPHFKNCIGAIDETHILATPSPRDYIRYIGRSGTPTQNVMAAVDFDMHFTYASIGQPGSMHDTSILFHAIEHDTEAFLHPSLGKYYVVDAGYPNRPGYLSPYKGQRYHVPDWRRGTTPTGQFELFNYLHSSLRNIVERTFGV